MCYGFQRWEIVVALAAGSWLLPLLISSLLLAPEHCIWEVLGILAAAQLSDHRVCTFEKNLKLCKPKELKNLQKRHTIMKKLVPEILLTSSSILLFWKIST